MSVANRIDDNALAADGYRPAYRMGGPIVAVSAMAEALVRRGHEVTVVTTNATLDEDPDEG